MLAAIVFGLIVLATASTGALFAPGPWYETLRKPRWTPPNWMFPVVWSVLYVAIAVAGYLVWRESGWSLPIAFWVGQIVLNAAWSWLFFGLRRMELALLDVSLLILCVLGFMITAQPVSSVASALFVPYLAWVVTAGALNLRVLQMNPVEARRGTTDTVG